MPPAAAKGGASARRTRTGTHAARDTRGMTPLGVRRVRRGGCSASARGGQRKFTRLGLGASEKEVQESQKSRFVYPKNVGSSSNSRYLELYELSI